MKRRRLMRDEAFAIRAAYKLGWTQKRIYTAFGIDRRAVSKALAGYDGIPYFSSCTDCGETLPHTEFNQRNGS